MPKPLTDKQQFWFNHVIAAKHCALPLSTYAAQHNLKVKSLYNWRCKFSQQKNQSANTESPFIKIIPSAKPILVTHASENPITQVTLPNGISLALPNLTVDILTLLLRA